MSTETRTHEQEWHKTSATSLFNLTWDLLDREERSQECIELADQAARQIEEEGNQDYFLSELRAINELLV